MYNVLSSSYYPFCVSDFDSERQLHMKHDGVISTARARARARDFLSAIFTTT